jgi:hypothetical protein
MIAKVSPTRWGNAAWLKLIMAPDPDAERHETGLSVRWDDMKVGFHVVPRARDAGGGGTDGSWCN